MKHKEKKKPTFQESKQLQTAGTVKKKQLAEFKVPEEPSNSTPCDLFRKKGKTQKFWLLNENRDYPKLL